MKFIIPILLLAFLSSCDQDPTNKISEREEEHKNVVPKAVKQGKQLFLASCASCHNSRLRYASTGPALGNVHLFREEAWLIAFTKNSQQLIAEGDSLAICVYTEYGTLMPAYANLSNQDIKDIYTFIASESKRLKIARDEVTFKCR